jgi:hypothetical protein
MSIGGRRYAEYVLERMAPNIPEAMATLERRYLQRAEQDGLKPETAEFGNWWRRNHPDPRGVPPMVVEPEIAHPSTSGVWLITNELGDVVTVIPSPGG